MRPALTSTGGREGLFPVRIACISRPSGVHLWTRDGGRGNIYHRKYEWDFLSPPLEAPKNTRFWPAAVESSNRAWNRSRNSRCAAPRHVRAWSRRPGPGLTGRPSFYTASGAGLAGVKAGITELAAVSSCSTSFYPTEETLHFLPKWPSRYAFKDEFGSPGSGTSGLSNGEGISGY